MLIFSPIMLCCSAEIFTLLCSIVCSLYCIVLIFLCIDYNLATYIRFFAIDIHRAFTMSQSVVN